MPVHCGGGKSGRVETLEGGVARTGWILFFDTLDGLGRLQLVFRGGIAFCSKTIDR